MEMNAHINKYKIFESLITLKYRDPKLENYYYKFSGATSKKMWEFCSKFLLFWSVFISVLEGILLLFEGESKSKNLKWNFIFCCGNLIIALGLFSLSSARVLENKFENYICVFLLYICYGNLNLSLISILMVYFQAGLELISLAFLFNIGMNFVISHFIFRGFLKTLSFTAINLIFNYIFLLRLHIIRAIIVFLLTETVFSIILVGFVYMSEYFTKIFYYSFRKLEQEKEYYRETLKFFNISYFKSKNYEVLNTVKIDEILKDNLSSSLLMSPGRFNNNTMKKIESLIGNMISLHSLPKEVESYMIEAQVKNNFKFKKLVEIIQTIKEEHSSNNENVTDASDKFNGDFLNYRNFGILKLKNIAKEDNYYQLFLKIKYHSDKLSSSSSINFFSNSFDGDHLHLRNDKDDVKIEGILLNITQTYLKKEIQTNSLILSKYIHDIKSPLFLLKQVVHNYKKINQMLNEQIQPIINGAVPVQNPQDSFIFTNNFISIDNFSTNNLPQMTINDHPPQNRSASFPLASPRRKITSTISTIAEHSNYLKIISKNIFQIIGSINSFTKRQTDYKPNCNNDRKRENLQNNPNQTEKVEIRKLIRSCVDFYNISIKFNQSKNNLKLFADIDEKIPKYVESDKTTLKQVLMNLLSNSIKFTNLGEIKIVCKYKTKFVLEEKNFVEINVIDTGCGIDEDNLPKLCQPFALTTSSKYGSGLGLSIVHDFLTLLNSKLSIYSVKGKGSVFSFELPIELEEKLSMSASDSSSVSSRIDVNQIDDKLNLFCTRPLNENLKQWDRKVGSKCPSLQEGSDDETSQHTILFEEPFDKKIIFESEFYTHFDDKESNESWDEANLKIVEDKLNTIFSRNSGKKSHSDEVCPYSDRNHYKSKTDYMPSKFKAKKYILPLPKPQSEKVPYSQTQQSLNNISKILKEYKNSLKGANTTRRNSQNFKNVNFDNNYKNIFTKKPTIPKVCLNILLIDDDPMYQNQLINQIKSLSTELKADIRIDVGYDAIEGLLNIYTALKSHNEYYDLILIDENMPFIKGSAFSKLYKNLFLHNGFYKIPFVSISSELMFVNDENGSTANIFDYTLNKPSKKKDIKLILEKVIQNKGCLL